MSEPAKFTASYRVRVDDINYGGHMGNERALVIFQDARILFLESLGYAERDIGEGLGVILPEAALRFRREAFLHDVLTTRVAIGGMTGSSFEMLFESTRESDSEVVLTGTTKMIAYDYGAKKVRPLPDAFRKALEPFAGPVEGA